MRKVLYREPLINGGYSEIENEGYFHEWIKVNKRVCAIIEKKDGTIALVYLYMVKFVDSPEDKKRWINVEESLPMKFDEKYNLSIAVNLKTTKGDVCVGHYNYTTKKWIINGVGYNQDIITEWKEINL